jgi:hypothetical protein
MVILFQMQSIMEESSCQSKAVHLVVARKQKEKKQEGSRIHTPSPGTYFLQLGSILHFLPPLKIKIIV